MKALKIIGAGILVALVVAIGFMAFGPTEGYLERSITINASKSVIRSEANNMKTFNEWSPWFTLDENAEYDLTVTFVGVGAKFTWYSELQEVGTGSMEIVASSEDEVRYRMIFDQDQDGDLENNEADSAHATLIFQEKEDATQVKWTFEIGNLTGPEEKIFLFLMEGAIGPFYEQGLQNLKERAESMPEFSVEIGAVNVAPVTFIGMNVSASQDQKEISQAMEVANGNIMEYLEQSGLESIGAPLVVYTNYSESLIDFIYGIPVEEGAEVDVEGLTINQTHEGLVVKAIHIGDYRGLQDTHTQIDQFISQNELEVVGLPWEDYPVDPTEEPDTSQWVTNVYYPVE